MIIDAQRKRMHIGALSRAWCHGYALGVARVQPSSEDRVLYGWGALGRAFAGGLALGRRQMPKFKQLEMFNRETGAG